MPTATPRIVYETELSPAELDAARYYARLRREHHKGPLAPGEEAPWEELMGTLGEMGVAKAFGRLAAWTDEAAYKVKFKEIPADVGRNVQVRTVDMPFHNLAVRKSDPLDAPYVLCLVTPDSRQTGHVWLLGWAWGQYVADNGRWRTDWPRPAWAVLPHHLKCMTQFPEECF